MSNKKYGMTIDVDRCNGCAACVDSHERVVLQKGMTEENVLAAVRIASTVHAVAAVLG